VEENLRPTILEKPFEVKDSQQEENLRPTILEKPIEVKDSP
jgi:hypothetical protein